MHTTRTLPSDHSGNGKCGVRLVYLLEPGRQMIPPLHLSNTLFDQEEGARPSVTSYSAPPLSKGKGGESEWGRALAQS